MSDSASEPTTQPWWHEFFDETFADYIFSGMGGERLEQSIQFLIDKLNLSKDDRVYDQCCGIGRLSLPLAEGGIHVIGVDQSQFYIDRATEVATNQNLPCEFHCADAFDYVTEPRCQAVVNWYNSFGYSDDDEQNLLMFKRAFESLEPGGRFALEFPNFARVLAHIGHRDPSRTWSPHSSGGPILLDEYSFDLVNGMQDSVWTYLFADGTRKTRNFRVRLYLPHNLGQMLQACGFGEIEFFGSLEGEPLSRRSPYCIVVAQRPS